ncbi:piggyBac transposable element-derived protein 4-like [Diabrotica virgifera virgifera]|uniref:PiggyBac transposable element-derived protein domain-containing protein n=3 Tax=Diabrotica virgifera virgifera TaxID=50390 RepID=A0ABM5KC60_DIAVI|nr:piggyBac transposable element-derived protein 4-like [Diabrotica virgifera virgifera]XP_050507773.1 piggyBac transposable element-derived protein 4-like [Diabrotica virgifera virgifera]
MNNTDDILQSGSNSNKKIKLDMKKKLTEEELLRLLETSDEEFSDFLDSDSEYLPESEDEIENTLPTALIEDTEDTPNLLVDVDESDKWKENFDGMKNFPFLKHQELLVEVSDNNPVDFFRMLLTDECLQQVCDETNRYAEHIFLSNAGATHSRIFDWKILTSEELLVFLGLVLHMGHISLPRIEDYWKKKDPLFANAIFSTFMGRNRFMVIMRCLHFNNNPEEGEQVPEDRIYKIRPMINFFNKRMEEVYYPDRNLSLDESMVLHRGRLNFRQYLKNKKHKYGIKLYMLTEPNGLILKFLVYSGMFDDSGGKGHVNKVVLHLLEGKLNVGHCVYMDNFYNSFDLAKNLLEFSTYCTGTLRIDRKNNPAEVRQEKLAKGATIARCRKGVLVGKWKDKRDVYYITTECQNTLQEVTTRRGQHVIKPEPIIRYNKNMSGIDRQDQMLAYYPSQRKTVRWPTKIFIHVIQMMAINAHILYNKYSGKKIGLYEFRLQLVRSLLKVINSEAKLVPKDHSVTKREVKDVKGKVMRKRCKTCSQQNIRKDTIYECKACPDTPGFCLDCCQISHKV